jgi:predicted nucleotidyltransferase component of viral defense system
MIKPGEIQKIAGKLGLRDTQIEKDYVIGWVLRGISNNSYLKEKLIFKGGTALRKIYFDDYRLSEDLDFTFNGDNYSSDEIKKNVEAIIAWIRNESRINLDIQNEDKTFNNFYLGYTGPLGGKGANKSIKVDIADDELLCNDPVELAVITQYSDLQDEFKILSYTLGEIISEKMRSLIQRTMPRDLYDIWYLFVIESNNVEDYVYDFRRKTEFKKLNPDDLTNAVHNKIETFKRQWENHLENQIMDIPDFENVWRELGKHWRRFEKFIKE